MRCSRFLCLITILGLIAACDRAPVDSGHRSAGAEPLRIVVSIAPLTSLLAALAPPGAEVTAMIPAGRSVHGHESSPADIARLGRAEVVVYIGLGLDRPVSDFLAAHPSDRSVVCFAECVGMGPMEAHDANEYDHGHDNHEGHDHSGPDPHLWLDPALVERLIPVAQEAILAARSRRGPITDDDRRHSQESAAALLRRVRAMDDQYRARLAPLAGRSIVTHHDAFCRIADRYNLRVAAVIRPIESTEPTPGAIAEAARAAKEVGAGAVFFEPQFDPASARRIAQAAGARLGRLDPEGNADWFVLMQQNLDSLTENLGD